ncbi:hypothetical protein C440_07502 [Haloferax mucosum ATCC BAA-1512]|uniref:Small CPxCG-related zinc finger protein n=2 Tax=Haloferax mucosum TaxID=403181 RepID=M0IGC7_9EURY|nr:hypothetical protein C440_07502 [Haloferax mucosum ATCC BAA-1512]
MIQPLRDTGERGSVPDSDSSDPPEPEGIEATDTKTALTDGGNPIHGAPEPITDGGRDIEDDDSCPDCGSPDYFDANAVLRARNPSPEGATLLRQHDRVCSSCGEVYDV